MEAIYGMRAIDHGIVKLGDKQLVVNRPQDAIRNGIALVTEDRRGNGIFGVLSVSDNVAIASIDQYIHKGLLDDKKISEVVDRSIDRLNIKTASKKTHIENLSGGNQQKVILSRWLANNPDILILDEPTRGIDVGAKFEIYQIINELAAEGKSIIMISSEMAELLGVSDRIMVMCECRVSGFLDKEEATQESVMTLATKFME
ncbi:ATP-binding cassette domain-containing protein [Erysipelothrix piscisicarius]|uniref:ATP-binding cassette domain-containing protein n=1 Tax=Erysipelothrix piscisicarius TaxID=2485784 RepID=UPI001E358DA4|nr:ATP-binding cassette domain-containing protein [Erysipelothrix piscisicarius]